MHKKPKYEYLYFKNTYESPLVKGLSYYDIINSDLCKWSLTTFTLQQCHPNVSDALCVKLRNLSDDLILIVENDILKVYDLKSRTIIQKLQVPDFVEEIETQTNLGIVVVSIAGIEDNTKQVLRYKLNAKRQLLPAGIMPVKFNDEVPEESFFLRIFPSGRVFLYKKGAEKIFEIMFDEQDVKGNKVPSKTTALLQLSNRNHFAVASQGKIDMNDPVKGTLCGYIDCKQEIYNSLIQPGEQDLIITASNKAVKLWPMKESKTDPKIYAKSQKMNIDKLYISGRYLIGMSDRTKTIATWDIQTTQLIKSEKILRQEMQKVISLNSKQLCIIVKIFDQVFGQNEQTLSFHNRLCLLDIDSDHIIASKEIKKADFNINIESLIRVDDETIKFICYSDSIKDPKIYLMTWKPHVKEEKKDITRIQMFKTPITKLYPYDRVLYMTPPRDKIAVYNAFGKTDHKTTIMIYSFGMKKVGQLVVQGYYDYAELSSDDKLYLIKEDKTEQYKLEGGKFTKQPDLKISLTSLTSLNGYLFVTRSNGDRVLYDNNFELVMKAEDEVKEPIVQLLVIDSTKFLILYKKQRVELWDIQNEVIRTSQLKFEVINLAVTGGQLHVTQSNRIKQLDLYAVFK